MVKMLFFFASAPPPNSVFTSVRVNVWTVLPEESSSPKRASSGYEAGIGCSCNQCNFSSIKKNNYAVQQQLILGRSRIWDVSRIPRDAPSLPLSEGTWRIP